jgi:hypothetical protein
LIWVYLHTRADVQTGKCWPSLNTIRKTIRTNRNHALEDIRTLEAAGWLSVLRRPGTINKYVVQSPLPGVPATDTHPTKRLYPLREQPVSATGTPTEHTKNTTRNTEGAGKKSLKFDPLKVGLPFQSDRFRKTWGEFVEHRNQIKKPLTQLATSKLLAKLERWGEGTAVQSLDEAVENGWQGVFEPKGNGQSSRPSTPTKPPYVFTASE